MHIGTCGDTSDDQIDRRCQDQARRPCANSWSVPARSAHPSAKAKKNAARAGGIDVRYCTAGATRRAHARRGVLGENIMFEQL